MEISAVSVNPQPSDRLDGQSHANGDGAALRLPRAPANGIAMSLERRRLQFYLLLVVADVMMILGSFAAANALYPTAFVNHEFMLPAYMLLPLFQTIAFYNSTYSRDGLTQWRIAAWRGLLALLISALLFNFFAFFAKANENFSRVVFVSGLTGAWAGMVLVRIFLANHIHRNWGPSATNRLLIDAGGPQVAIANVYRVNAIQHGLRPDGEDPQALDRLSKYLTNMDMVIVSCPPDQRLAWSEVLRGSGIHGEVISDFAHELGALAIVQHEEANVTALVVSRGHLGLRQRVAKRVFDLGVSSLALLLLSPVLLVCAVAIVVDDGRPVFFRQRRMGQGNQFFNIFKFRTMRTEKADALGVRSAAKDDDRITRVGHILRRTSLDELPQLINVLKGEMSLVGPRPHALGSLAGEKMFWQIDHRYWHHGTGPGARPARRDRYRA